MRFELSQGSKANNSMMWSGIENAGLAVLSFLTLILLSRHLAPSQLGLFSIVLSLIELLGLFVSMLFHDVLIQRESITDKHFNTAFTVTMSISVGLFGLSCLLATIWAQVMGDSNAASLLIWTALTFPLTGLAASIIPRCRRNLDFRDLALGSLLGRVCGSLVAIAMLFLHTGVWALVAQQLCMAGIASFWLWFRTKDKPRFEFDRHCFKDLIGYGSFSLASLLASFATRRIFIVVSGLYLGATASGYMNLGFRLVDVLWAVVATAVSQVALPVFSRLRGDKEKIARTYFRANQLQGFILLPCFATIAVLSREIIELSFGAQWLPAAPCVATLAFLTVVQLPKLLAIPMLKATGSLKILLAANLTELILICVPLLVMQSMNLQTALTIWIVKEATGCFVVMALVQFVTGFNLRRQLRGLGFPAILTIAMGLAMFATGDALPGSFSSFARLAMMSTFCAAAYLLGLMIFLRKQQFDRKSANQTMQGNFFERLADGAASTSQHRHCNK